MVQILNNSIAKALHFLIILSFCLHPGCYSAGESLHLGRLALLCINSDDGCSTVQLFWVAAVLGFMVTVTRLGHCLQAMSASPPHFFSADLLFLFIEPREPVTQELPHVLATTPQNLKYPLCPYRLGHSSSCSSLSLLCSHVDLVEGSTLALLSRLPHSHHGPPSHLLWSLLALGFHNLTASRFFCLSYSSFLVIFVDVICQTDFGQKASADTCFLF